MQKLFVSYPIALKFRELGFEEPCFGFYPFSDKPARLSKHLYSNDLTQHGDAIPIAAPLYQQVQDWFRDNHNIQVDASSHTVNQNKKWRDYIAYVNGKPMNDARDEEYQDYYKALTKAIEEALKLIENGRN